VLRGARVLAVLAIPAVAVLAWQVVELSFLDGRTYRWGMTATAIAGGVIVAGAALRAPSPLRPVIELAPVAFLGRISYSVYLWHLPIIEEVSRRADGDIVRVAVISIPLTFAVGAVSYALIERPLMSAGGRARLRAAIG
jgi:peptidoglycan/LPS O-acetylase OafA/YrhL